MNPIKAKLQQALAILSIIGGAILSILSITQLVLFYDTPSDIVFTSNIILFSATLLLSLAIIALGVFFIKKSDKSIPITILVLSFLLIFPSIVSISTPSYFLLFTFSMISGIIYLLIITPLLILNIIYLSTKNVKKEKKQEEILNRTKHIVKLSAATLSILTGCLQLILTIISMVLTNEALGYFGDIGGGLTEMLIVLSVFDIVLSLSLIILGLILTRKNSIGIAFGIIAVTIILIILSIINIASSASVFNIIMLVLYFATLALTITYVFLKDDAKGKRKQKPSLEAKKPSEENFNKKIEDLKKLKEEKIISEEDYNKLLLDYLDKV